MVVYDSHFFSFFYYSILGGLFLAAGRFTGVVAVAEDGDEVVGDEDGFGDDADDGEDADIIDEPKTRGEDGDMAKVRGVAKIKCKGVDTGGEDGEEGDERGVGKNAGDDVESDENQWGEFGGFVVGGFVGAEGVASNTDGFDGDTRPSAEKKVVEDATGSGEYGEIKNLDFAALLEGGETEDGGGEGKKLRNEIKEIEIVSENAKIHMANYIIT